jgi:hypothetical protein
MRRSLLLACSALGLLLAADPVAAKTLDWEGTLTLDLGPLGSTTSTGVGVATLNAPTLTNNLRTIRLSSAVFTITQTDNITDTAITPILAKIEIDPFLGTDTFANISGPGPIQPGTLPLVGLPRVCFVASCTAPATMMRATPSAAIGVGGTLSLIAGGLQIDMVAAPWTVETASGITQTASGALVPVTVQGSLLGLGSATARTSNSVATPSGQIQFVTPIQVSTVGIGATNTDIAGFATLTLHFVPEPGLLLLLSSGAVGLAILGRRR